MNIKFKNIINGIKSCYGRESFISLHEPVFFGNEKKYLLNAIDSTFVSSVGKYVDLFEEKMCKLNNVKKTIAVVNGTSALHICLKLANVGNGDEVITQALTFVATANAISYLNARPVFVDVDLETMGLSPSALQDFLDQNAEIRDTGTFNKTTGNRISACVVMHTFGFMCEMDEIIKICKKWNILIVEDSAESLGSKYKGRFSGSIGDLSAFSFNGNKIITSGAGGSICTNNELIGKKAKHITTTAKVTHKWEFYHDELGYNYRMSNINAALACAQLENINEIMLNKKLLYDEYKSVFMKNGTELVSIPKNTEWNYWLMCIRLENKKERDLFLNYSNDNKVMTRPIWQLMYRLPMYKDCQRDSQKNAEYLESRIVNIPSSARI